MVKPLKAARKVSKTEGEKRVANKAKAHTRYRLADNTIVPGVTTLTGILNKPALVKWANNLGLEGISVKSYVDEMASIGTLAHYIVECHVQSKITKTKVEPDFNDYTPNQIDLATNSVLKFYTWEKAQQIEYIASEMKLVSEMHRYGGCCDIYCKLNGNYTLIDLKTCKGIYPEQFTQVVGYAELLKENGHKVDDVRILRIGRDESEGFDDKKVPFLDLHWQRLLHCLEIYRLNKVINKW